MSEMESAVDTQSKKRPQSFGEEIANSITHGIATLLAIAAIPILVVTAVRFGDATAIVSFSIFGASLFILYLASTIYHALPQGRTKHLFGILDHCAIYILIAGTYTPILLVTMGGGWGWSLFGVIWGLALCGVIFKSIYGTRFPMLSNALYLGMGWIVLIAIKPLVASMPVAGLAWLVGGGLAYTIGIVFYIAGSRWLYAHTIWHLFVLTGSLCHFFAVLFYVR